MSDNKEKILEKLNVTTVNNDIWNRILSERLNYAFDSLYFRFALAIKELGEYKQKEAVANNEKFLRKKWESAQMMNFHQTLEKLSENYKKENSLIDKKDLYL